MGFNVLSGAQQLLIMVQVRGGPKAVATINTVTSAVQRGNIAMARSNVAMTRAAKSAGLYGQALFTARRYAFYATTAVVALSAAVFKMGFSYNAALQEATVALKPVMGGTQKLNAEMAKLFHMAAFSPFQFKDMTVAFRTMFASFHSLGFSVQFTNDTLQSLIDALSYAGKTTPAALNRVSVQLQHMAFVGRPTGQMITNLGRDGLPIWAALRKELKLNDDQIKNIASSGITAKQVIGALNKFIREEPGFANAALRIQLQTFTGAWTTFKDLLSQGAGSGTLPIFSGIQKMLANIDREINKIVRSGKKVTLEDFAKAINNKLTPGSNALIDIFYLIGGIMKGVMVTFGALAKTIAFVTSWVDNLTERWGWLRKVLKVVGFALGVLIGYWLFLTGTLFVARTTILLVRLSFYMLSEALYYTFIAVRRLIEVLWTLIRTLIRVIWLTIRLIARLIFQTAVLLAEAVAWMIVNIAMGIWIIAAILIIGIIILLVIFWKQFKDAIVAAAKWVYKHWQYFMLLAGGFGLAIVLLVKLIKRWDGLKKAIQGVVDVIKKGWHWISRIGGIAVHAVRRAVGGGGGAIGSPVRPIAGKQSGGPISTPGAYLVGEAGPEIVRLPGGASVIPNNQAEAQGLFRPFAGGAGADRPIIVQVVLDRKVIAQAVARANQDYLARK